jgi:hypothetical protein
VAIYLARELSGESGVDLGKSLLRICQIISRSPPKYSWTIRLRKPTILMLEMLEC